MATPQECPKHNECGFRAWREDEGHLNAPPLPQNQDCGIEIDQCLRLNPLVHQITIEQYGPHTYREAIQIPKLPNENGRPQRRIIGGGHL